MTEPVGLSASMRCPCGHGIDDHTGTGCKNASMLLVPPRPCTCRKRASQVLAILGARLAAVPDAGLAAGVEALAFGEAASAVMNGVVGTTPDNYGGVTKDEALDYAGELVAALRALLAAPSAGTGPGGGGT